MIEFSCLQTIVLAVDEPLYYRLWYHQPGDKQSVSPRITPPPTQAADRPESIFWRSNMYADPIVIQSVDSCLKLGVSITGKNETFLRPADSPVLGPNAYIFTGAVTAYDKWRVVMKHPCECDSDTWVLDYIVDCGLPLEFHSRYTSRDDPGLVRLENRIKNGVYMEGIVRLSFSCWSTTTGLHQKIGGNVQGMEVLEMNPQRESFGKISGVPFGCKLTFDPDAVAPLDTIFATLDVTEIGPLCYGVIPARAADCPEPDYEGLIRLEEDKRIRIRTIGEPK